MSRVIAGVLGFAFLVWVASTSYACMVVPQEYGVLRNFAIQVYNWRGAPVPGARVVLSPSIHGNPGPEPLAATTDAGGIARFRNVPAGAYSATTESSDGEYVEITVIDSGSFEPVRPNLRLKWPNLEVIPVQSASGKLTSGSHTQPLRLALLKADSGERLESVETDTNGNFHFSDAGPGLYFIRVTRKSSSSFAGDIAISIEPTAKKTRIDLSIGWTSCGLSYGDDVNCTSSTPLEVANLCGRVVDPSGAVIFNPLIQVISATDGPMRDRLITSKQDGTFAVSGILPGQYTLQVSGQGFSKLQLPVRVQDGSGTSCVDPLTVTLGIFPSCSKAEVESRK